MWTRKDGVAAYGGVTLFSEDREHFWQMLGKTFKPFDSFDKKRRAKVGYSQYCYLHAFAPGDFQKGCICFFSRLCLSLYTNIFCKLHKMMQIICEWFFTGRSCVTFIIFQKKKNRCNIDKRLIDRTASKYYWKISNEFCIPFEKQSNKEGRDAVIFPLTITNSWILAEKKSGHYIDLRSAKGITKNK